MDPAGATTLTFDRNTMLSATISSGSRAVYTTSTGGMRSPTTKISDAETGRVLAKIASRTLQPDTIVFSDGVTPEKEVKLSQWMQRYAGGAMHRVL
ncbi:hypothetical protein B0H19DRAFT_1383877 [Mycena capillaripes]|nr:hypothetical protein B0H19DRAFT_1383877 [Mycena capillaripes]